MGVRTNDLWRFLQSLKAIDSKVLHFELSDTPLDMKPPPYWSAVMWQEFGPTGHITVTAYAVETKTRRGKSKRVAKKDKSITLPWYEGFINPVHLSLPPQATVSQVIVPQACVVKAKMFKQLVNVLNRQAREALHYKKLAERYFEVLIYALQSSDGQPQINFRSSHAPNFNYRLFEVSAQSSIRLGRHNKLTPLVKFDDAEKVAAE